MKNTMTRKMSTEQTTFSAVLGVVLAGLRKDQDIEQAEMATRMGLSQASYSRLESGKSAFSVDQMYQAAEALGISVEQLHQQLGSALNQLKSNGIKVLPQIRGNSTFARSGGGTVGRFVAGAALGALLVSLLGRK